MTPLLKLTLLHGCFCFLNCTNGTDCATHHIFIQDWFAKIVVTVKTDCCTFSETVCFLQHLSWCSASFFFFLLVLLSSHGCQIIDNKKSREYTKETGESEIWSWGNFLMTDAIWHLMQYLNFPLLPPSTSPPPCISEVVSLWCLKRF